MTDFTRLDIVGKDIKKDNDIVGNINGKKISIDPTIFGGGGGRLPRLVKSVGSLTQNIEIVGTKSTMLVIFPSVATGLSVTVNIDKNDESIFNFSVGSGGSNTLSLSIPIYIDNGDTLKVTSSNATYCGFTYMEYEL